MRNSSAIAPGTMEIEPDAT